MHKRYVKYFCSAIINMSELPQEQNPEEASERQRRDELEVRFKKLHDWAQDQEFVTVYRAEGDPSWKVDRSLSAQLVGTWYTDRYEMIEGRYKPEIENNSGMPARVFALIIPKSLLESREAIDRGMNQVNVLNEELRAGRQEISNPSQSTPSSLANYLDQFDFVREYRILKAKYG